MAMRLAGFCQSFAKADSLVIAVARAHSGQIIGNAFVWQGAELLAG
jgi:hypothetical protein